MPKLTTRQGKRGNRPAKIIAFFVVALAIFVTFAVVLHGKNIAVLNPQGYIADQERNLIIITCLLALVVVVPVFIMLFTIAWKYRATNTKAKYEPDMEGHRGLEALWWGIPIAIITVLGFITWQSTHALDPYKPIASINKPITIQVVALDWKWLFIYPQYSIATVNYFAFPEKTPVNFTITSDAPMNSFWIPSLAGQIYAMSGMSTQLHIEADGVGNYQGSSANISGSGFAGMTFVAKSMSQENFNSWKNNATHSTNTLNTASYAVLASPSKNNPQTTYKLMTNSLYDDVIMKYMAPGSTADSSTTGSMQGMSM